MSIARQADMDQLRLERALIAQGMDPLQAEREAAMSVLRYKQSQARESMARTADGRPALGEQEAAFDSDMAMAMGQDVSYGNGADVDNLAAASTPIEMDAGLGRTPVPQSARVYRDDPTQGLAGVLAAREAEAARNWEERGAHYGPKGDHYALTYGTGPDGSPSLSPIQSQNREARAASEDRIAHAEREVRIRRLADRAGVSPAVARASMDEARNGIVGPLTADQRAVETQELRDAAGARRQQELAARQGAVVRRRMAQTNPLEYMNRDDISDWNRMVAADSMLRRGYRGATPLDVEQAAETAKALQQQRMAQGQGFQQQTPEQQELLRLQIEAKRRELQTPQERAAGDVAAGRGPFAGGITARANEIVNDLYSRDVMGIPSSQFTAEEVELAAQRLHQETGLPLEEARQVMARIREERHGTGWLSGLSWM